MLLDKQPLTRAELGTDDLGALRGGCQGHCQSWGGNLDKEEGRAAGQRGQSGWQKVAAQGKRGRQLIRDRSED